MNRFAEMDIAQIVNWWWTDGSSKWQHNTALKKPLQMDKSSVM